MNRRKQTTRLLMASLLLLGGLTALSCGGGGGNVPGGMMGGGLVAAFTANQPMPAANSISMSAGTSTGDDMFEVVISVTNIDEFFGAGFRVSFDSASAQFLSFDESNTFLQEMLGAYDVTVAVDPNDAGMVLVSATLQSQVQGTNPMTLTTNELLTLVFRATNASAGNAFGFDGAPTRVVTTCPALMMACTDIPDGMLNWDGGMMTAN